MKVISPFVLRTTDPTPNDFSKHKVTGIRRLEKRIVLDFEGDLHAAIHLMILGRLHWKTQAPKLTGKTLLAVWEFENGFLSLTESSSKKRASIHLLHGEESVQALKRGGLEPLESTLDDFQVQLKRENRTLKRALTDPRLFAGIGNAYSDEILHRARLSPFALTTKLNQSEVAALFSAVHDTLTEWTDRLRLESISSFPDRVTAFRPEMRVHGRYGKPCPDCGNPVQRIVYAENESNYCAVCQTEGRLLSDRSLSRLLKEDWPKSLVELEEHFKVRRKL